MLFLMALALSSNPPTWMQSCCTWRMMALAAIDWAAFVAWIASVNWVGVVTVGGAVILTGTLAVLNVISHVNSKRIEWFLNWEKAHKESFEAKAEEAEARRVEAETRAAEERRELMAKITESEASRKAILDEMAAMNVSVRAERESIHNQRREMQAASALQIEESIHLRKQLAETSMELVATRRELAESRAQVGVLAAEIEVLRKGSQRQAQATERVVQQVERLNVMTGSSDNQPAAPPLPSPPTPPPAA